MKKLLLLCIFAALALLGSAVAQTPSMCQVNGVWVTCSNAPVPLLVQSHAAVSSGSVTTLTNAFASNNTAGNSIVVAVGVGNGGTATVTDSNSNVYNLVAKQCSGTTFCSEIFNAVNIKGASNTVTVAPTSSVSAASNVYEFSGFITATNVAGGSALAAGVAVDQTNGSTTTGTVLTTGAIGTILPNEYAVAAFSVGTAAQTITVASPFNNDSGQQNVGGTPTGLFSFVSASSYLSISESIAATATITSEPWAAAIASFKSVILPVEANGPTTSPSIAISVGNLTANTTAASIKATSGNIYGWAIGNPNATACYLQLFNTSSVTLGTTTEIMDIYVPGTGGNNFNVTFPINFSTAIYAASTTAPHGTTTCTTGMNISIFYE
jgi:hypothetical protein